MPFYFKTYIVGEEGKLAGQNSSPFVQIVLCIVTVLPVILFLKNAPLPIMAINEIRFTYFKNKKILEKI